MAEDREMLDVPVIIVTGASKGIGADTARWLGKIGAAVTLIARSEEKLNAVASEVEELGGKALVYSADIAGREACIDAVEVTLGEFGRIDGIVNNAGILSPLAPLAEVNTNAWLYNIEVNLFGPFYLIQAAVPHLCKTRGRVINVSSGAAETPVASWGAYCIAKAGLNQFSRVLAVEEPEITVIAVRPGVADTEMQELIRKEGPYVMHSEKADFFQNLWEEGRLIPPSLPARTLAWLALYAPAEMSGEFIRFDDERIDGVAEAVFGETI